MKKLLLFLLIANLTILPAFAQLEINLSSVKKADSLMGKDYPVVYKPSRLVIGKNNVFKIKAEPGSVVELLISGSNIGAEPFYGHKLRLGEEKVRVRGQVPENGILELAYQMPNNREYNGKIAYFEVIVWKDNINTLKIAKIMAEDCHETNSNEILVTLPPENVSMPSISPMLPMMSPEFMKAIQNIENGKNSTGSGDETLNELKKQNIYQTPAYIRNLNAPELMNTPNN